MDLKDKNILVGITGSIAAYKAVYLVSSLKSENANVNVVMTENAAKFVTLDISNIVTKQSLC